MKRIVVLISNKGTGTNLQAIIDGVASGKIQAEITAVISDTKDALGLKRARKHKIPIKIVSKKESLLPVLTDLSPDYICLAGWKQIILDEVIKAFPNRILNTHPGLIPDKLDGIVKNPDGTDALWNKGKMTDKAMQNFLNHKTAYAGCTNHFLSLEFDFGPVLGRVFEKIKKGDSVELLYTRLKAKENKLYVKVLAKLTRSVIPNNPPVGGESKDLKTILVVDGGGRGAVLVDKYAKSAAVGRVLAVPGNDLMQINTKKPVVTYQHLKTTSVSEILEVCQKEKVDLVDVAQDNAVEAGLVDKLLRKGIAAVGPSRKAGQIEWDKAWARKFMKKYQVPGPKFQIFKSEKQGIKFVKKNTGSKWFVKAAGLAEGKGVIPASNTREAVLAIKQMKKFGPAGETYLLEEWLQGEEFSAFAICDGKNFRIAGFAQDHKRVNDRDQGLNTGGMGCVSNPLIVNSKIKNQISKIFEKTIAGLIKEKRPYKGVLYLGGMVVESEVFVIEFNARWGDPEAEVILPGIKNDLYQVAKVLTKGSIRKLNLLIDQKTRVAVAVCSKGYPVDYSSVKGKKVFGIDKAAGVSGVKIYGAGIKKDGNDYKVQGGRILFVVGEGKDVLESRKKAYKAIKLISVEGDNLHFRTDIGWRDADRMKNLELK